MLLRLTSDPVAEQAGDSYQEMQLSIGFCITGFALPNDFLMLGEDLTTVKATVIEAGK